MAINYKRRARIQHIAKRTAIYLLLTCLAYVVVYPLFGRIMYSFMSEADLNDDSVMLFAKNFTWDNYTKAIEHMDYWSGVFKCAWMALLFSFLQTLSTTLLSYGIARFNFPGKGLLFTVAIVTLLIPQQIMSIPLYFQFRNFDIFGLLGERGISLLNTTWPVALLASTGLGLKSGLLVFMLRQYFGSFPKELEEAAAIDGAGPYGTFIRIVLPSATTMLVTAFLFSFVWYWTDSFNVTVYMPSGKFLQTQVTSIYDSIATEMSRTNSINIFERSLINNAAILLFILPLVCVFLFCQRYFIESVERTGIVG